jgi:nucleotide-binding universal stress UspA family protein
VEHADPAQALIFACRDADLVLLARPAHGAVFGHLGHTARAVLRSPGCPIEVLPVKDAAGAADEELAAEEAALLV